MGRKSTKAKDKKMKRKEEMAKLNVIQAVVDKANQQEDPMAQLQPFKTYNRNGLKLTISCNKVADVDEETVKWAFELTKDNMEMLYVASEWDWNDKQKFEEMSDERAWYLVARDESNKPVAFVHFRFDVDFEVEVLYCYEIQLISSVRRKGLGKFLMQILELLAHKAQMKKVMCTVFNNNYASKTFFMEKLRYEVDETSPEETMAEALYDEDGYTYQILSKKIGPKSKSVEKSDIQENKISNGH